MKRLQLGWVLLAVLTIARPTQAQMAESQGGHAAPTSPFLGSVPQGTATAESIPLSLKDAVNRALQFNLGLLLQEQAVKSAHGAHWRALADLLPNVYGSGTASRQVINLEAYGFPGEPKIIGPFNVFDARVFLSQPVIDLRAINGARAASANERAETLGVRTARDLVTLVAVNLYLQAVAGASRIEAVHAQEETARALFTQTSDMKNVRPRRRHRRPARAGPAAEPAPARDPRRERIREARSCSWHGRSGCRRVNRSRCRTRFLRRR